MERSLTELTAKKQAYANNGLDHGNVRVWIRHNCTNRQQKIKKIRDGHVSKDDVNQLDRAQNQQLNTGTVATNTSLPGRGQKKEVNCNTLAMQYERTIYAHMCCMAPLPGIDTEADLEYYWTDDIKQWTGASVAKCVQCASDRNRWSALVSMSVTSDSQSWEKTKSRPHLEHRSRVHFPATANWPWCRKYMASGTSDPRLPFQPQNFTGCWLVSAHYKFQCRH